MSKAEEYSFNIPSELFQQLTKEQQVLWRKEIENTFNNGYHQAKKDNELTLDDIKTVIEIADKFVSDNIDELIDNGEEWYYKEVLKRFKEIKK